MFFQPDIRFRPKVKNRLSVIHWAESIKFFGGILVQTIFSKRHFEINWPLVLTTIRYVKVLKRLIEFVSISSVPSIPKDVLGWPKPHHKLWGEKKNYDNCLHIFHPFSPFDAPLYTTPVCLDSAKFYYHG